LGDNRFEMKTIPSRSAQSKRSIPPWLIKALTGAFLLAALLSVFLIFRMVYDLAAAWTGTGLPSFRVSGDGSQGAELLPGETPTIALLEEMPDPWNGTDRVTILLMGLDYRDWEEGEGPSRTDSMMLVTIDPISLTAGMLSIPRDLWVEIPAYGHGRINTAYFLGEKDRLPGGGPALAVKTVERFLGVPIQYYVQIDFGAFVRMIDEIGGVEVDVPQEMRVDPIGPNNVVYLEPGVQILSGEVTLGYARQRKTEGGDFDRAQRQQQVAIAIRDRVLSLDMVPTLVAKSPALYQELAAGIHTNLSLDQMLSLGLLALKVPAGQMSRGVIAPPYNVTFEKVLYGGEEAEVLKPVPDQIRLLRDEIFTETGAIGPSISVEEPAEASKVEDARLAVLNGAGESGIAGSTADILRELGLNIVEVANADRMDYPQTRLIDYTGNPYTTQYLLELMDLTQSQILIQPVEDSDIDVAVVMGYDWFSILQKMNVATQ
jgi:LCP family protein required for cell wall assembly